ncbi:MAG: hypothetical protein RLY50_969, partial [Actinomycetota bacterium]
MRRALNCGGATRASGESSAAVLVAQELLDFIGDALTV